MFEDINMVLAIVSIVITVKSYFSNKKSKRTIKSLRDEIVIAKDANREKGETIELLMEENEKMLLYNPADNFVKKDKLLSYEDVKSKIKAEILDSMEEELLKEVRKGIDLKTLKKNKDQFRRVIEHDDEIYTELFYRKKKSCRMMVRVIKIFETKVKIYIYIKFGGNEKSFLVDHLVDHNYDLNELIESIKPLVLEERKKIKKIK